MFYYLKGELVMTDPFSAVVDCGGVGYKTTVSGNTLSKLTHIGERVCLYTYFYLREDAAELYGFYTTEELAAFKLLIGVSGVGPKAAMAVLSILTPERFALAVSSGDVKAISKASGVGGKTAARIVLELKDKVAKEFSVASVSSEAGAEEIPFAATGNLEEAVTAMMVLGYSRAEAESALRGVSPTLSIEEMLTAALKNMAKRF